MQESSEPISDSQSSVGPNAGQVTRERYRISQKLEGGYGVNLQIEGLQMLSQVAESSTELVDFSTPPNIPGPGSAFEQKHPVATSFPGHD
jgi:hypothetical protein